MEKENFVIHACEQVLRFSKVEKWDNLSEERKVQLGFNMGVMALGLGLTKQEGYQSISDARSGIVPMREFREYMRSLISSHKIVVDEANVAKPF